MTREEAIKWIIYEKESIDTEGYCATKENYARIQALDMAIEVLCVKDCHGCTHYDLLQTPLICHDCSRSYKDRYKDEKGTLDDMFTESAEAYKAWTGEEMGRPHGRLIDADKFKKQLDTVYNEMANERERKGLRLARWFLISAPTVSATKKLNNQIHLCDSCKYNYQKCPSENEDVLFGNGVGNDNICCCAKYLASADRPHGEWEHTEEVTTMDGLHWHIWRCTNCNSSGNPDMNFCPNCGAKMGGDGE